MNRSNEPNGASEAIGRGSDQASQNLHQAGQKASQEGHAAVDQAASQAHRTADKASRTAHEAASAIDEHSQHFQEAQEELLEKVRLYVQENPVQALAIAAGAGFVLNWLIRD